MQKTVKKLLPLLLQKQLCRREKNSRKDEHCHLGCVPPAVRVKDKPLATCCRKLSICEKHGAAARLFLFSSLSSISHC